jgi:GTP cyclohydrolase I
MSDLPEHLRAVVAGIETEIGEFDEPGAPGTPAPAKPGASLGPGSLAPGPAREIEGTGAQPRRATTGNRRVEDAVRQILAEIGEDPDREGLAGTPERVHRMYAELTAGYHVDPERLINEALFEGDYREMVVVRSIPFYSLCEHHLLPFFGEAAVAYIPNGRLIGLSKIPRIVEMYARRLQVQERMTQQIADFLMERLQPLGVGVVIEATHLCSVMRGVRKEGTVMTTSHVLGLFRTRDRTRAEFLAHLERAGRNR